MRKRFDLHQRENPISARSLNVSPTDKGWNLDGWPILAILLTGFHPPPPPKSLCNITFQVGWISGDLNTTSGFSRVSSLNKHNSRRDGQPLPGMYVNAETRRADTDEVHRNAQLWMRNLCHEHTQNKRLKWPKFIFKIKTTLSKLAMMQHLQPEI